MSNKFVVGDKVKIKRMDKRIPKHILDAIRLDHPRTITAIFYDNKVQHTRYYLGTNKRGDIDLSDIHFRSSQLFLWERGKIGRPKSKRQYNRHQPIKPIKPISTKRLLKYATLNYIHILQKTMTNCVKRTLGLYFLCYHHLKHTIKIKDTLATQICIPSYDTSQKQEETATLELPATRKVTNNRITKGDYSYQNTFPKRLCPVCLKCPAISLHHIVPLSQNGSGNPKNKIKTCKSCHDILEEYADNEVYYSPALANHIRMTLIVAK